MARRRLKKTPAEQPPPAVTVEELVRQHRGIHGALCPQCSGWGRFHYSNTGTWRARRHPGMIVGHGFTWGVCDVCWGSGSAELPGENLHELEMQLVSMRAMRGIDIGRSGEERMGALLADKYHTEKWYISTGFSRNTLHLYVTKECPFREHKPVDGIPVDVHVMGRVVPA